MKRTADLLLVKGSSVNVVGLGRDGEQVECQIRDVDILGLLFMIAGECSPEDWREHAATVTKIMEQEKENIQ